MNKYIIILIVSVVTVQNGLITAQQEGPADFFISVEEAVEYFPDPYGYLVVRGEEEQERTWPYDIGQSVALTPIDASALYDQNRSIRIPNSDQPVSSPDTFGYSGTSILTGLFFDATGGIQVRNSINVSSNSTSPFNPSETVDGVLFSSHQISGTSAQAYNLQGGRGDSNHQHWGGLLIDESGQLGFYRITDSYYNGDFLEGIPSSRIQKADWRKEGNSGGSYVLASLPDTPNSLVGGSSIAGEAVIVAEVSSVPTAFLMSTTEMTSQSLTGLPSGTELLAATQNVDGEILVIYRQAQEVFAWSSIGGITDIGTMASFEKAVSWFTLNGSSHVFSGDLLTGEEYPVHLYRSPGGNWHVTELSSFAQGDQIIRTSFDLTRTEDLRIALHTRTGSEDVIRLLTFIDEAWTSHLIEGSGPDATFNRLRCGGISNDGFLIVYKRSPSVLTRSSNEQWRYYQEGGPVITAVGDIWNLY